MKRIKLDLDLLKIYYNEVFLKDTGVEFIELSEDNLIKMNNSILYNAWKLGEALKELKESILKLLKIYLRRLWRIQ